MPTVILISMVFMALYIDLAITLISLLVYKSLFKSFHQRAL